MKNLAQLYYGFDKPLKSIKKSFVQLAAKQNIYISFDQWLILQEIKSNPGISQSKIAENCLKDVASINRIIKILENKDLIFYHVGRKNKRKKNYYLTHQGNEQMKALLTISSELKQSITKPLFERELHLLQDIILRMGWEA